MSIRQGDYIIADSSGTTDNETITTNLGNQIQAIGTKNKNESISAISNIYDWIGTLEEYNTQQIGTLHPTWLCYITDDIEGGESVYTKEEVDEGFLATNKITNCITEIPQDIKLELSNGILTLKAGSKVYVPNGFTGTTPKFDEIVIASDLYVAYPDTSDTKCFLFYNNGNLNLGNIVVSLSGTTPPTTGFFYNTSTNKISFYLDGNMVWDNGSFPLCIASCSNSSITSIDQVFNGFGYIGSTVFALPGVKGLIPDGRNADGTLKNIEFTISQAQTFSITSKWGTGNECWWLNGTNLDIHRATNATYFQDSKPSTSYLDAYWFSPKENILRQTTDTGTTWKQIQGSYSFNINFTNGKITSLTPKTAFHALDYNDSSTISGWSMPSSRYIDLTLGASGSSYTAPANGYVAVSKMTTAQNQNISINCNNFRSFAWGHTNSINIFTWMPVNKGDVFRVTYSAEGTHTDNYFRFIYAEGEN